MSRIGREPVGIPEGVRVTLERGHLTVNGPGGELSLDVHPEIGVEVRDAWISVTRPTDRPKHRSLHGLTRSLIANMIEGTTKGFKKTLQIQGVGYKAERSGGGIKLALGFSHPIQYDAPEGITIDTPDPTTIVIGGADKQLVGQTAAEIRGFRPPEPYKGKGVRYLGERVRRKAGKTAAGTA